MPARTAPPEPQVDPAAIPEMPELRSLLENEAGRLLEMSQANVEARGDTWTDEVAEARSRVVNLDAVFNARYSLDRAAAEQRRPSGAGPTAATLNATGPEVRSLGQQVIESDGYRSFADEIRRHGGRSGYHIDIEVRAGINETLDANGVAGGAFVPRIGQLQLGGPQRRDMLAMRDLLPSTTTQFPVITYIQETYVTGSLFTFVAEGATKPETQMAWAVQNTNAQKIAAWIRATWESLQDAPQLRGQVDNRLRYQHDWREDHAILYGSGTAPEVRGILQTTGVQTQAKVTDTFQTVGAAMPLIETHGGRATGIVMYPSDFWTAILASWTTYNGAPPFQSAPGQIWGLDVVRTTAQLVGHATVGDFRNAAEIFDREDVTVRVGDQHSDFFINNLVAILMESRLALAVYRPDLFVDCSL